MKRIVGLTVMGLIATNLLASQDNVKELEKFFYNKGYQDAKNSFYEKGYKDALRFAEDKLKEYRAKINALEQGKYLLKNKKITYPEVYQLTDKNGNIKVVVGGCKIEKPLTSSEILALPLIDKKIYNEVYSNHPSSIHAVNNDASYQKSSPDVSNAVFLPENDNISLPQKPSEAKKVTFGFFPNTTFYKKILDKSNVIYTIYEDKIKALFPSKEAQRKFCKLHNLKMNKDCL